MTTKQQCAEMRKDLDGCVYSRRELEGLLDSYEAAMRALDVCIGSHGHLAWCASWNGRTGKPCNCGNVLLRQYDGEAG